MEQHATIIEGKRLGIGYRNGKSITTVHKGLDFRLRCGELTCLLGANGAGKSTLLRTLAAAQPPLDGELTLLGKPISGYSERERSRTIGVVLTDKTQTGGLTVYELVALGRQPHTGFFGRLHHTDKEIIEHALYAVGILNKARRYMAELSDGERQKAMIAKALVQECPLILLDEPTAFLDVVSRIEIMTLLHRLAAEEKKAILLSTHDIEQALVLSDRLWLLTRSNGLECGVTEDRSILIKHLRPTNWPYFWCIFGFLIPRKIHRVMSTVTMDKRILASLKDLTVDARTVSSLGCRIDFSSYGSVLIPHIISFIILKRDRI